MTKGSKDIRTYITMDQFLFLLVPCFVVLGDGGICITHATDSIFSLTSTTREGSFSSELVYCELFALPKLHKTKGIDTHYYICFNNQK